jgi:hypothetical protein
MKKRPKRSAVGAIMSIDFVGVFMLEMLHDLRSQLSP